MRALALGLALIGLWGGGASPAGASTSAEARAWLERMHAAASQRSYVGTMVYSAGGQISSARVTHYCVGDQTYEHVETLDGRVQRVLRHNQAVHTVWPRERVAVVDQRDALTAPRSPAQTIDPRALERYTLQAEGSERVAGREALVFTLRPLDDLRYAHRLWADRASGLMLRADVIGPGRAVLESSAFSSIEIDVRPQPAAVLRNIRQLAGYKVLRPRVEATSLEAEGWMLARPVDGFRPVGCVRRPLELPVPAETDPQPAQVVQQVYSDGLAQVSLFVEPFDPQRHRQALQGKLGATGTFMQRRGEHWVTAMGDVPVATLKLFVEGLERRR